MLFAEGHSYVIANTHFLYENTRLRESFKHH